MIAAGIKRELLDKVNFVEEFTELLGPVKNNTCHCFGHKDDSP